MTIVDQLTIVAARLKAVAVDRDSGEEQMRVIIEHAKRDPAAVLMDVALALVDVRAKVQKLEQERQHSARDSSDVPAS